MIKFFVRFLMLTACITIATTVQAQEPETITESTVTDEAPLDDIVERTLNVEKRILAYDKPREADLMWEKRIWRVLDLREKMNFPFSYPEEPFAQIVLDNVKNGTFKAYSTVNDKFSIVMTPKEIEGKLLRMDTVPVFDPETYEESIKIVPNEVNVEDFKRIRVKEIWYFDSETSMLNVRILGLAPIRDVYDDNGNFKYEDVFFWVYYPHMRKELAKHRVFLEDNDASPITWEDFMEMRYFSSFVYKESNVKDNRIQDYMSGVDALMEGEVIKSNIFNWEHDLWEY